VSLAPDFLALETPQYTNRREFLARCRQALEALNTHIDPQVIDRLGVRYIDRISGKNLSDLGLLVKSELAGVVTGPLGSSARHSITETVFTLPEEGGDLKARWGLVPAQSTVDPAAVDPIGEESWILDLDAFVSKKQTFDVDIILSRIEQFARRIYSLFRWAVTNEFLKRYGGQL
jgi:uncharacterized protein (TIGR04255 family)